MVKFMIDKIVKSKAYKSGEWFFPKDLEKDLGMNYQEIGEILNDMSKLNKLRSKMKHGKTAYKGFSFSDSLIKKKWV